jgi:hypothetical protein
MRTEKRSGVPSIDRGSSPRNALSDARLRSSRVPRLGHRVARSRRLCTPAGPFGIPRELDRRPRAPLPAGSALLSVSAVARRFLQPFRRTGTPFELPILAREWGFRSAARPAPTDARLRRPLRCVATPGTCEPRSAHAGFHSDVLRLRGRDESRAEALEQRPGSRALLTMSRVPFS